MAATGAPPTIRSPADERRTEADADAEVGRPLVATTEASNSPAIGARARRTKPLARRESAKGSTRQGVRVSTGPGWPGRILSAEARDACCFRAGVFTVGDFDERANPPGLAAAPRASGQRFRKCRASWRLPGAQTRGPRQQCGGAHTPILRTVGVPCGDSLCCSRLISRVPCSGGSGEPLGVAAMAFPGANRRIRGVALLFLREPVS